VKKDLNPMVVVAVLVVVAVAVVVVGYRALSNPGFKADSKGDEATMKKYKETGVFYQPPADAPIPRPGSSNSSQGLAPGAMSMPPGMGAPGGAAPR
jgi:hypothetical protein